MRKWLRLTARHEIPTGRGGRPRQLSFETLEELMLLSSQPWSADHEAWRSETYSISAFDSTQVELNDADIGGVDALGTQYLQQIGATQARQQYGYTGAGYAVAVIDTGIDYTHSAFSGRYLGGWDFVQNDADPMDANGHGTHVAGIIGSSNSSYLGIAPGVSILALRVLDASGSGSFGAVEDALQWVVNHRQQYNIVAVNMSLGAGNYTSNPYTFLDDEMSSLEASGVFVASAAGNSYYTYGSQQGLSFPAISSYSVSVGAVWDGDYGSVAWGSGAQDFSTASDRLASFSQRGGQLDILAPGAILTNAYLGGGSASLAGTSMATPVVVGAAVVLRQAIDARGLTSLANQNQMLAIMKSTGVSIVDGDNENDNVINTGLSFKRVNLLAAIGSLGSGPTNPPPDNGVTSNQAFVTLVYQNLLGRAPDSSGLSYWTQALSSGTSREQVARQVRNSNEHRGLQINDYYNSFLGRSATSSERDYWINAFRSGATERSAIASFLGSPGYSALHPSNTEFMQALYQDLLGRAADSSGLAWWNNQLATGTSRARVVDQFLSSVERNVNVIGEYYQDYLGRTASASEKSYWDQRVRVNGLPLESAGQAIMASQEYLARAIAASSTGQSTAAGGQRLAWAEAGLEPDLWSGMPIAGWQGSTIVAAPLGHADAELWKDGTVGKLLNPPPTVAGNVDQGQWDELVDNLATSLVRHDRELERHRGESSDASGELDKLFADAVESAEGEQWLDSLWVEV